MLYDQYFEQNKILWNKRTAVHKDSEFYDVPSFLAGRTSLTPIELNDLGDVTGKKILHLQCHFGLDSLSLARMGADVTGIDLSDDAINEARLLNEQAGLNAKFICCNVYDLKQHLNEQFDIVFTTYGVIGWLPDLDKWAELVSYFLKPGGLFYMAEFHPVLWMFDDEFRSVAYAYDNKQVIVTESEGSYGNREAAIKEKEYNWNHSLSEVINSLIHHGLAIQSLNEYDYSPYDCFSNTVQVGERKWCIRGMEHKLPMVYSIKAIKG